MSNDAFILAEAELLHALGVLLVSAYESSVEMASKAQFLDEEKEQLVYNEPTVSVDMFMTPPPPFQDEQLVYTIVPGQIRTAAIERNITPSNVYGDVWVASSGFTKDEEEDIERSYYYQSVSLSDDDDDDDDEGNDLEEAKKDRIDSDDSSDTSAWSECSSVEDSDSEMDMDDYEEEADSVVLAGYHLENQDHIDAHYNHFPPNQNMEDDESDFDEDDSDEDMADDIDYAVLE